MKSKAGKTRAHRSREQRRHEDRASQRKEAYISPEEESWLLGLTREKTSRSRTPGQHHPRPARSSVRG